MPSTGLRDILAEGVSAGASDWHIREGEPVAFRLNGDVVPQAFVADSGFMARVLPQIADDKAGHVLESTGDVDFALDEVGVGRFRVNVHRQRGRVAMTLRHVKSAVPSLEELRLPPVLYRLADCKDGIIFVTGSTGSGKSTTLACMIEHINQTQPKHVITIEDPIEYNFIDKRCIIEQREVGIDTVSFDSALRHALRQDPDIIVVGELRSRDSFETALAAAETGHLVMTTLHTATASQSIARILDFYPHEEREAIRGNLAGNLRAIICQRLVPTADGSGIVPINEILINTPISSKLIQAGELKKLDSVIAGAESEGMQTFNTAIMGLIRSGLISEETGFRHATNPESLKMNLKGIYLNDAARIIS